MIVELIGKEAGITFECIHIVPGKGDCSRMHPHFHYADITVDGEFDDKRRIIHLYKLKAVCARLCSVFEDKILLANYPETVQKVVNEGSHLHIEINNKFYLIPEADILKLEIPSLNIEDLAIYFADELVSDLKKNGSFASLNYVEVTLSEGHGQRGRIRRNLK